MVTAMFGTITASPQMPSRMANGIPAAPKLPSRDVPSASARVRMYKIIPMTPLASAHHQNSLRLARPVKVAYFWKPRFTAGTKPMP